MLRRLLPIAALALAATPAAAEIALETVLTGLANPVRLVAPAGDDRLFVVQRAGLIRVFDQDGTDRGVFLDLTAETRLTNERGLLGLAFAPDYATTGSFYVSYTDDSPTNSTNSEIWRFRVSTDPDVADPASGELLLSIFQPQSNHNGGHIEFGPDGMLYIGIGDGGGANDTANNAQNPELLLGKLLRLDVSGAGLPSIPPDNPFVGLPPRDEIWATGLRNPWCFAFDRLTGDLYIADVGQATLEEVDIQPASSAGGENYGWRRMEGTNCFNPPVDCNDGSLTLPVYEYDHSSNRCSISGGYVYRGPGMPSEDGNYFFADFCTSEVWTLRWTAGGGLERPVDRTPELTRDFALSGLASFGQDGLGELYVIENGPGRIHRIIDPETPSDRGSVGRLKGRWRAQEDPGPGE
jgi:glucose/arabinose dehydrogenase